MEERQNNSAKFPETILGDSHTGLWNYGVPESENDRSAANPYKPLQYQNMDLRSDNNGKTMMNNDSDKKGMKI